GGVGAGGTGGVGAGGTGGASARAGILYEMDASENVIRGVDSSNRKNAHVINTMNGTLPGTVVNASSGGYGANWDATRFDFNAAYGVPAPENNWGIRHRLQHTTDYGPNNSGNLNKPRTKFSITGPGGMSSGRFTTLAPNGRTYFIGGSLFVPNDYEVDGQGGQEQLMNYHGPLNNSGDWRIEVNGSQFQIQYSVSTTTTGAGSNTTAWSQNINQLKGRWTSFVIEFRGNPFSTKTTINSSNGTDAQLGETYNANTGVFKVAIYMAKGDSGASSTEGAVTNSGSAGMVYVVKRVNQPVGLAPSWLNGKVGVGQNQVVADLYKGNWFGKQKYGVPPDPSESQKIPNQYTTKAGPIVYGWASVRVGDSTSDYRSVHPTQAFPPAGW
nr:hypothetical protein [Polyangiaceae bacterium]